MHFDQFRSHPAVAMLEPTLNRTIGDAAFWSAAHAFEAGDEPLCQAFLEFSAAMCPDVIHTPGLDVICRGEGEDASVELMDALDRGEDHRFIKDLWVKHEGRVYQNGARPRSVNGTHAHTSENARPIWRG